MKTILVRVTWEDIRNGVSCSGDSCPVALALGGKDRFRFTEFWVTKNAIRLNRTTIRNESIWVDAPQSVTRFIGRFDAKKPVKPFSFRLKVP